MTTVIVLTSRRKVLQWLRHTGAQLLLKSRSFHGIWSSFPCSQQPTTKPHPEPSGSNPHRRTLRLSVVVLNTIPPPMPKAPKWFIPLSFHTTTASITRPTSHAHRILHFIVEEEWLTASRDKADYKEKTVFFFFIDLRYVPGNSVTIVTDYGLDDRGSINGNGGSFSAGEERPRRDADHLPPPSAKVKKEQELHLLSYQAPPWRVAGPLHLLLTFDTHTPHRKILQINPVGLDVYCGVYSTYSTNFVGWVLFSYLLICQETT
jgi:hypothetical protein